MEKWLLHSCLTPPPSCQVVTAETKAQIQGAEAAFQDKVQTWVGEAKVSTPIFRGPINQLLSYPNADGMDKRGVKKTSRGVKPGYLIYLVRQFGLLQVSAA